MTHNVEIVLDHISQRDGICQFQQDIINRTQVDILDSILFHVIQNTSILHFTINGSISSWSQRHIVLILHNNLAIVVKSRDSSLWEKDNRVFVISKIFVGLEVVHYLLMVHLTCHQIPLDESTLLVVGFTGQFIEPCQSVCKEAEQSQTRFQLEIKHSLWMVESQPSALTTTHNADRNYIKRDVPSPLAIASQPIFSNSLL